MARRVGKKSTLRNAGATRAARIRIGFVDLIDASPLIVASASGFFSDEGLRVELERQLGWGNIRDRLTFGQLDAAHALIGMPLFSQLRREWFFEPLIGVMNLGAGGDAITLSRRLFDAGVRSASSLGEYIRRDPRQEILAFGHVFGASVHHYLLREWLAGGGIDPDRDVRLRVFPPNQLAGHMQRSALDGFCVGEPWNTLSQASGAGQIVAATTDIIPNHPDKVLAVSRRRAVSHQSTLVPMIRAILRACAICDDESKHDWLAELLARPEYLNTSPHILRQSLALDRAMSQGAGGAIRTSDWHVRSFAANTTFPNRTHTAWFASQMLRWRHLPANMDPFALAEQCADASAYREAAASLGIPCPAGDFAPMPLRSGTFQLDQSLTTSGRSLS